MSNMRSSTVNMLINKNFMGLDNRYCLTEKFLCMHVRTPMSVQILTYAVTHTFKKN